MNGLTSLYDRDFHAWASEQAALMRTRSANEIDWENIAEELEDLGRSIRGELRSRYRVLIQRLLKWRYQPNLRPRRWQITIGTQRGDIAEHVERHPSLKAVDDETFLEGYAGAVRDAVQETGLPKLVFPAAPPFTRAQALDEDYWPEEWKGPR